MSVDVGLEDLEVAARQFAASADLDSIDPRRLAALADLLQALVAKTVHRARERGEHLLGGRSACSWVADTCQLSRNAAADRLCVGQQLQAMARLDSALSSGEIGFQAASVICHLQDRLDQVDAHLDEEMWIANAKKFSIKALSDIAARTWHAVDPEGFCDAAEENFERRQLFLSQMDGMYRLDGWLDAEGGAALKTAIDSRAGRLGADDTRSPKQRRADALTEIIRHAMDRGTLPRRNGVRPHITVITTLEGLKGELGAAASELQPGMAISSKTVQRLACEGSLTRVLKSDSLVVDVGRATRSVSPAQWWALKVRHKTCCFPGCDRPVSWTSPHHVEFWSYGGPTDLRNIVPLCYYHHRLVHEGGWQVVRAADTCRFIPPDRFVAQFARRRWGERPDAFARSFDVSTPRLMAG